MDYAKENNFELILRKKKVINKRKFFFKIIVFMTIGFCIINLVLIYNFYKVFLLL